MDGTVGAIDSDLTQGNGFDIFKIMEMTEAVKALAALAQESRLEVFRLLVKAGADGLPAGRIAESLATPPATLSFHLKELVNAGLIERRRESRQIIYSLRVCGMRDLIAYLTEDCCEGRPELCQSDFAESACCDKSAKRKRKKKRKVTEAK